MRYASVCSGIEAATVAWHTLGWEPAFFSEIEPFPSAVLQHHYPNTPNLGDFTKIGAEYGPVDLLVGGTPCQSFSVAGQRAGLDDPRGNLAIEFFKLARRLNATWVVWENVPGVHSSWSDEEDVTTAETPEECKDFVQSSDFKSLLDIVSECGYSCAWRILDAQFFGVPQRRRRVFLVGHTGNDWRPPVAVLFESDSLRGDIAAGGAEGEGVAGDVAACLNSGGNNGGFRTEPGAHLAMCLNAHGGAGRMDGESETFVAAPLTGKPYADNEAQESRLIAFDTTQITSTENGCNPKAGDPCHPLAAGAHAPAVCFESRFARNGRGAPGEIVPPLKAESGETGKGDGAPLVCLKGAAIGRKPEAGPQYGEAIDDGTSYTLNATEVHGVTQGMQVRRLTPRECERLQGFPDDYTAIRFRGKAAADGPRYRALGNSMAVNVMEWLGRRIDLFEEIIREASR